MKTIPLILSEKEKYELHNLRELQKETSIPMNQKQFDRLAKLSEREFGFNMGHDNPHGNLFRLPDGKVIQGGLNAQELPSKQRIIDLCKKLELYIQEDTHYQACISTGHIANRFDRFIGSMSSELSADAEVRNEAKEHLPIHDNPERDWTEDFSHENGNYMCICSICKEKFYGHKRRPFCKLCSKPDSVPEDEKKAYLKWCPKCKGTVNHLKGRCITCGLTTTDQLVDEFSKHIGKSISLHATDEEIENHLKSIFVLREDDSKYMTQRVNDWIYGGRIIAKWYRSQAKAIDLREELKKYAEWFCKGEIDAEGSVKEYLKQR